MCKCHFCSFFYYSAMIHVFFLVMQRELDKIDRFATKIVDQAKLSQSAASKLTVEVKVSK